MTVEEKAAIWTSEPFDHATQTAVASLIHSDRTELEESFYKDLEFGTGGMRGIMGVGTNRINKYTLGKATQGLANYLKQEFKGASLKVAIAFDCRNNSLEFSRLVADVLSANGVKVFLFESLRPTPELSFAVRHLGCHSGIVITASHNPPQYNGYKVYWNDGAQIVAPHDRGIINEVNAIEDYSAIKFEGHPELIEIIEPSLDDDFVKASLAQSFDEKSRAELKVVFTALHGTSITILPKLLQKAGYQHVYSVEEQATPDGNFPTVDSPNPEEPEALSMAIERAKQHGADLVIGTDPDSDRIGVAAKNASGEFQILNGNQCGVLLTDYILSNKHAAGELNGKQFIAYTIVSSDMFDEVAKHYNVRSEICLTGFKHIASLIRKFEGELEFLGGGEESFGYMVGDFVRDKDAMTSALLACDLAARLKAEGKSMFDHLAELSVTLGHFTEHLHSMTKQGKTGAEEIRKMMEKFRGNPPSAIGGEKVVRMIDYQSEKDEYLSSGRIKPTGLPQSNVLQFFTEQGSKISVRPSGTEPKIKFYFSVKSSINSPSEFTSQTEKSKSTIHSMLEDLIG